MKILFYLGHPAHFHLFKNIIKKLNDHGHEAIITIKSKDVLASLLQESGIPFINLTPQARKDRSLNILASLIKRDFKLINLCIKHKPQLLLGSATEIAHVGRLLKIPSLVFFEDDLEAVPQFAKLAGPFAEHMICPESCSPGRWSKKAVRYNSYHELAYLTPGSFQPDLKKVENLYDGHERYFLIRFAKLTAYHDDGKKGITRTIARNLVNKLKPQGRIYITSERPLEPEFEEYRLRINPLMMHDVLHFAHMYIGDSQTMTAEAAVLGTPAIRFNDFVGQLGYLQELEDKYQLTYGIQTSQQDKLYETIDALLEMPDLKEEWRNRKNRMLSDKIDLTEFLTWYIENYPESSVQYKNDSSIQYRFKINAC